MRERWWGATGRRVPELALAGDPTVPVEEALVLDGVADVGALQEAFRAGRPVVVTAGDAASIKAALGRPEVAAVLVPADRADLLAIDLTELTYG